MSEYNLFLILLCVVIILNFVIIVIMPDPKRNNVTDCLIAITIIAGFAGTICALKVLLTF